MTEDLRCPACGLYPNQTCARQPCEHPLHVRAYYGARSGGKLWQRPCMFDFGEVEARVLASAPKGVLDACVVNEAAEFTAEAWVGLRGTVTGRFSSQVPHFRDVPRPMPTEWDHWRPCRDIA